MRRGRVLGSGTKAMHDYLKVRARQALGRLVEGPALYAIGRQGCVRGAGAARRPVG